MIVIVRSAPDTPEGRRGVKMARDMSADIVLLQNGTYFLKERALDDFGFVNATYVLDDDKRLRGLRVAEGNKNIKVIDYSGLVDLMAGADKVIGAF
jgi:sulfur relay protein TusB/DsrH